KALVDVRQYPRSRRFPHFNDESLAAELPKACIEYLPFKSLCGRRRAAADSMNTRLRNETFCGHADFMPTDEVAPSLRTLTQEASRRTVAIMCAEAVPWRCHRSLISDGLVVRGWTVLDIIGLEPPKPHTLTPFARTDGHRITYPAGSESLFESA